MREVDWARLKAHELRALAAEDAVVILPIAAIEQHGPHLPVMTDTRLGHEIALRAARKACASRPCVVAPVVWSGLSEHHREFGGTLSVTFPTFRAILRDLIGNLVRLGFRDVLISNSHGGNETAMRVIVDELAIESPARLVAVSYASAADPAFSALLEDQTRINHACEAETSMMMAVEPDLVDTSDLAALGTQNRLELWRSGSAAYRWRPVAHASANGVLGNPAKATAAKGEALIETAAEALAALIRDPASWDAPGDIRGAETGGIPFRDGG